MNDENESHEKQPLHLASDDIEGSP
jgi:hypothetical protein